jgi:hypothetical protein
LKTKSRSEGAARINLVDLDPVLIEHLRASLMGSPFHFLPTPEPLPPDEADLYVVPAAAVADLPEHGVPVIAWGPSALLRASFIAGCADYLREPWAPEELAVRSRAALSRLPDPRTLPWGEAVFEGDSLRTSERTVALTHHEAVILRILLRHRGRPVPRAALSYSLGGRAARAGSRSIDMHVSALRRKLYKAVPAARRSVVCVKGMGYMVRSEQQSS